LANFTTESLAEYFNQRVTKFGPSTDALQWNSTYSQDTRYHVLMNDLPAQVKFICDLGCGCGDLYHYIKKYNLDYDYVGLDISANMIVAAQQAYPAGDFRCLSFDQCVSVDKFDVVIASGVFNLKCDNHEQYVLDTIETMLAKARYQVRFNMLSDKTVRRVSDNKFVYVNVEQMQQQLNTICECQVVEGYLPNDVMFICKLLY